MGYGIRVRGMAAEQPLHTHRRFDVLRGPQTTGTALLAVLTLVLGLRAVQLQFTSALPAIALASGIRTPVTPPGLGLPLADGVSVSMWLIETVAAIVFMAGFWYWTHYAKRPVRTRGAAFRRVWAGVVVALVAAHIVRATATSLLSGEGFVSYVLMLGGGIAMAVVVGLVLGLIVGAVCAAVAPARGMPSGVDTHSSNAGRSGPRVAGGRDASHDSRESPSPDSADSAGSAASR